MTLGTMNSSLPISPAAKAVSSECWLAMTPVQNPAEPAMTEAPRTIPQSTGVGDQRFGVLHYLLLLLRFFLTPV